MLSIRLIVLVSLAYCARGDLVLANNYNCCQPLGSMMQLWWNLAAQNASSFDFVLTGQVLPTLSSQLSFSPAVRNLYVVVAALTYMFINI